MSAKVINGQMQITRNNRNKIHIEVQCSDSLANFLAIELTTDEFAMLVTGCHQSDIKMQVRDLEKVGKKRVREVRQVFCDNKDYGISAYDRDALEKWIEYHCREEGWEISSGLRSQKSIVTVDGGVQLNYSVCKWIDIEESK